MAGSACVRRRVQAGAGGAAGGAGRVRELRPQGLVVANAQARREPTEGLRSRRWGCGWRRPRRQAGLPPAREGGVRVGGAGPRFSGPGRWVGAGTRGGAPDTWLSLVREEYAAGLGS